MNCPKCKHHKLNTLQNYYAKCASCQYKFSIKRHTQECDIIHLFCSNISALHASNLLHLNYRTVSNKYMIFRKLIASYLEEQYYSQNNNESSYEEYYYFTQRQKEKRIKSLYDAINIIGFYSNKKVYTLLMPPLKKFSSTTKEENLERYLTWHKLQSANAYKTPLKVFFAFCEQNMKKYKGINNKNFFYYLKESEFKYNYILSEQIDILKYLYFK